jgi:hypothetical protein
MCQYPLCPHQLLKRLSFFHSIFLALLSRISWQYCVGLFMNLLFYSTGLCVHFNTSTMLFLLLLLCSIVLSQTLWNLQHCFFFVQYCLGYSRMLCFHVNFRIDFSITKECHWKFEGDCIEHFNFYTISVNLIYFANIWAWEIILSSDVFFNFFLQWFIVSISEVFYLLC